MVGTELDNLVARLAGRDEVDGIVFVGSTGTEHMAPTSDYDVLLVLADSAPPFLVGLATFDHRVTDLLFATVGEIEQLLTGVQPPPDDWRYRVAHWIRSGTIVFDHNGRLARLRRVLVAGANRPELRSGHGTWFSLN